MSRGACFHSAQYRESRKATSQLALCVCMWLSVVLLGLP